MVSIKKATIKGITRFKGNGDKKPWVIIHVQVPNNESNGSFECSGFACYNVFGDKDIDYKLNDVVSIVVTNKGIQLVQG